MFVCMQMTPSCFFLYHSVISNVSCIYPFKLVSLLEQRSRKTNYRAHEPVYVLKIKDQMNTSSLQPSRFWKLQKFKMLENISMLKLVRCPTMQISSCGKTWDGCRSEKHFLSFKLSNSKFMSDWRRTETAQIKPEWLKTYKSHKRWISSPSAQRELAVST